MNNIDNCKRDELTFLLNSSPAGITPPHAATVTVFTIIFLIMMAIPAHIAIAMLLMTFIAVCWQIRLMFGNTNKRIKQLEGLLLIANQDKKTIEIEEGRASF